jgi:hypothetical protein
MRDSTDTFGTIRKLLVLGLRVVGWTAAGIGLLLGAWIAGLAVAAAQSVGETAPGEAARSVAAAFSDQQVQRIDEGRFCGPICMGNMIPLGPAYGGSGLLLLDNVDPQQVVDALERDGYQPGDGDLTVWFGANRPRDRGGWQGQRIWHSTEIADARGIVVHINGFTPAGLQDNEANLMLEEALPPLPQRAAPPAATVATLIAGVWATAHLRRRHGTAAA